MQLFLGNLGWMNTFTKKEVGAGSRTALSFSVCCKNAPQSRPAAKLFPSLYLCVIPGAGWWCAAEPAEGTEHLLVCFFEFLAKYIF